MTKKDNLYSEVVINESPFYYDDHGRLRVHVLNEAQYISTADMRMDPVTGKKGPSKTIKISKDITDGSATFTARDKQTPDYSTFGAMSVTGDGEPDRKVSRNPTYFQGPLGLMTITPLDGDGKPYRSGSSTSDSPRVTRIKALDKDGKPYRNALSGLTDKEIDKLFKSGDFRVGPGGVPKRPTEAQLDAVREERGGSVKKYASGMPLYGNDEPNSDMIARPAVMPPADRERPLPGTARIAVPRPDTARPPSNMKRPLPVRDTAPTAPVRGKPVRPIGGRPGLGRLSPIRGIVGSGRNTNIRTGLRGVRPAARAMQKSAPATDYLNEKMNLKTAKMGDVIKDFQKSDAPQFEGKSKAKRRIMAIAAKLQAEKG
jgi:hypothetical protein